MEPRQNREAKRGFAQVLLEWCVALLVALVVAVFLTQVVVVNAKIPSESMENTIRAGDRVIGNRLAYLKSDPQRWDIVIFRYPDDESQLYVKRVVGMPGETVHIVGGRIYINGAAQPLEDQYLRDAPKGDFGPYQVPEGCYFVMGDNRDYSWDSRYWHNTYVRRDAVIGKAVVRLFPNPTLLR